CRVPRGRPSGDRPSPPALGWSSPSHGFPAEICRGVDARAVLDDVPKPALQGAAPRTGAAAGGSHRRTRLVGDIRLGSSSSYLGLGPPATSDTKHLTSLARPRSPPPKAVRDS